MRHLDKVLSIMEAQSLYTKESKCEFRFDRDTLLGSHHQCTGGTGTPGEYQGHFGLANAQECDRVEELLGVMKLL
jgi:hypothetical protein